jgi:hypothetical protein
VLQERQTVTVFYYFEPDIDHLSIAECPVFYFLFKQSFTIKLYVNSTAKSYIARTMKSLIITKQLRGTIMEKLNKM